MHNCLLSSAIIIYLSHSSEDIRRSVYALQCAFFLSSGCCHAYKMAVISTSRSMLKKWQEMLALDSFQLENFLSSEQEQLNWLSEGLPSDYMSIQNAIIISQVRITLSSPSLYILCLIIFTSFLAFENES